MSKIQLNAILLSAVLACSLAVVYTVKPFDTGKKAATDFADIPMELDGWTSIEHEFGPETVNGLPGCSLLLREYIDPDGRSVTLAIVYGQDLGNFHQPEQCLQGQGWRIDKSGKAPLVLPSREPIEVVNLMLNHDQAGESACTYWFMSGGKTATFLGSQKIRMYWYRLSKRKIQPAALVRFMANVEDSESEAARRIERIAVKLFPYLEQELR